jgi:hypothetical protein
LLTALQEQLEAVKEVQIILKEHQELEREAQEAVEITTTQLGRQAHQDKGMLVVMVLQLMQGAEAVAQEVLEEMRLLLHKLETVVLVLQTLIVAQVLHTQVAVVEVAMQVLQELEVQEEEVQEQLRH